MPGIGHATNMKILHTSHIPPDSSRIKKAHSVELFQKCSGGQEMWVVLRNHRPLGCPIIDKMMVIGDAARVVLPLSGYGGS